MSATTCKTCAGPLDTDGSCPKCLMVIGLDTNDLMDLGPPELASDRVPGYRILETIGRGGMGSVFLATHEHLGRNVAIKVLTPAADESRDFSDRFRREARTMAGLTHPNIVAIHDFGEDGDLFWLVMEHVDGVNLRQLMDEQLSDAQAFDIVRQICDGLHYAHHQGVVHRDIKPENVLVDRAGRVKLADFGLAKLVGGREATRLTGSRHVMGTPLYMAPEQVNTPLDVDHRADIYAVGVVLYELLTGKLPIGRFEPPSDLGHGDEQLDAVVVRALEHEPPRRYQNISDIRRDLDSVLGGELKVVQPANSPVPKEQRQEPDVRLPLILRWWELLVCAFTAPLCFLEWSLPGYRRGANDNEEVWGFMVATALAIPLVLTFIHRHRLTRPQPTWTLSAALFAFIFFAWGMSAVAQSGGFPAFVAVYIGTAISVVGIASVLRWFLGRIYPDRSMGDIIGDAVSSFGRSLGTCVTDSRRRLTSITVLACFFVLPIFSMKWETDYAKHWTYVPGVSTFAGAISMSVALGLPVLFLVLSGLGLRGVSGLATMIGGGLVISSCYEWLQHEAESPETGTVYLAMGFGGLLLFLGLIMLLSDLRAPRGE